MHVNSQRHYSNLVGGRGAERSGFVGKLITLAEVFDSQWQVFKTLAEVLVVGGKCSKLLRKSGVIPPHNGGKTDF